MVETMHKKSVSKSDPIFCYSLWGSLESAITWDLIQDTVTLIRLKNEHPLAFTRKKLSFLKIVHPEDVLLIEDSIMGYLLGKSSLIDVVFRFKLNQSWRWVRLRGQLGDSIDSQYKDKIVGTLKDVTESQLYLTKITRSFHFDPLTGLFTRKHFITELFTFSELQPKFALMVIELYQLNHLKNTLGFSDIDNKTLEFAERLRKLAPAHSLIGQFASDTFIVAVPQAMEAATCIEKINQSYELDLSMQCSCGIAEYPNSSTDIETLISMAHAANHLSRTLHSAYEIYSSKQNQQLAQTSNMVRLLRQALKNKEITFYLQPKFSSDKTIKGAELLCRWHSEEYGFVSPAVFIPLIEQYGLTRELYLNAFEFVTVVQDHLLDKGINIILAINITTTDIISPQFIKDVTEFFQGRKNINKIEFEVTESIFINDMDAANTALNRLSLMGFRIAMDDFGTGYSSLAYISKFNFDTIKIDQSFVADMLANEKSRVLVSGIIGLCHALNINIVAEGVETDLQFDHLSWLGVQRYQGFLLSKPLPLPDFYEIVERRYSV